MLDVRAHITDVADIDEAAAEGHARVSGIPRSAPGFTYVQLVPERVQVWRGPAEFSGRTVMRAGVWLEEPVD